jgi:hypothetical protein
MATFDVLCIGNAIVDILSRTEDAFLEANGIIKGAMNLIDGDRAELLYSRIKGQFTEMSGGSAGNTAAGVASLGGRSAYFGKVATDHLGRVFAHDIRAQGVAFDTRALEKGSPTARSMIFVTADGERSMNTYLGACVELGPEDVETSKVADARVTYFEGYLWDPPRAKEAIVLASKIAHEHGRQVAMTLSDPFCVDRYREEFLDLMRKRTVDIVLRTKTRQNRFIKPSRLMKLWKPSARIVHLRLSRVRRKAQLSSPLTRRCMSPRLKLKSWSIRRVQAIFTLPASYTDIPKTVRLRIARVLVRLPQA